MREAAGPGERRHDGAAPALGSPGGPHAGTGAGRFGQRAGRCGARDGPPSRLAPTAGLDLNLAKDQPLGTTIAGIHPGQGIDTLFTVEADPDGSGRARPVAVASGNKAAGAAKTSKVVWVAFPLEDVVDLGNNNPRAALEASWKY